jgi:hypothetical protein
MINSRASRAEQARQARTIRWIGYWLMAISVCSMATLFFTLPLPKTSSDHAFPGWTYTFGRVTLGVFALGLLISLAPGVRAGLRRVRRARSRPGREP